MVMLAAGWGRFAGRRQAAAATLLAGMCCAGAFAQELSLPAANAAIASRPNARARMEVSASSLPRLDSADGATRSTRLDMLWLPPRHPSLGLALGLTSLDATGFRAPGSGSTPSIDLGLHWRYDEAWRIDITAWRRMTAPDTIALIQDSQANYGARLEMQMNSMKRGFRAERGFLGLQLESGARIGVRRFAGHPMLYYRTSF